MTATSQANVMPPYAEAALLPWQSRCRPAGTGGSISRISRGRQSGRGLDDVQGRQADADRRLGEWMAAAQAGDGAAYQALLRDCVPVIKSIVRRRGVADDRVDDVVQDVLLTVHRARQTYDPSRSFTAWMSVIAERRAIDLLRRVYRQQAREVHAPLALESHADETADPARGVAHAQASGTVARALDALPARQREAVQHLVVEERSLDAAAALTQRSKGSLKVNLHRALKALRGSMGAKE